MCGIYGVITPVLKVNSSEDEVLKMMRKSEYRGPDSQNIRSIDRVCFGFNRLSIIDLDKRSDQPLDVKSIGKLIVFNGEIYNYLEIKKELAELGYAFSTNSDTEVALMAFHHYGEEAFNLFNGMWAMCIYDYLNNEITLSRDRFGVKPLYYMMQEGCLYFASEIKSLRVVKTEVRRNQHAIDQFRVFGQNKFSDGKTLIEGIMEHPAGCYSQFRNDQLEIKRFYKIPEKEDSRDYCSIRKELLVNFRDALKLRMRSDVPIALLLSGGLDSSLIAHHLNDMINTGELPSIKIHAFTLHFEGFKNDEWNLVQNYSALLPHIICEPIHIAIDAVKQEIPSLMQLQDIPTLSVSHLIHIVALRKIKAKGFTVVLNGQGADEVFGGYFPKDIGYLLLDLAKKSIMTSFSELRYIKRLKKIPYSGQFRLIVLAYIHSKMPKFYVKLKSKGLKKEIPINYLRFRSGSFARFRANSQVFETEFNGILYYEDMASMLNSIEMRSPFLDYRIVNVGLSIPSALKLHQGYSKWILRDALGEVLPKDIQWANWKLGYAVPKSSLLSGLINVSNEQSEKSINDTWKDYNLNNWLDNNKVN
jgi:asparagine synthase (glutamine-hydrolysing)